MLHIGQRVYTVSRVEVKHTAPYLFRTYVAEKEVNGINQMEDGCIVYTAGKFRELVFHETLPGQYQTTDGFKPVFLNREDAEKERLARIEREGREAPGNAAGELSGGNVDPDGRYAEQRRFIDETATALGCVIVSPDGQKRNGGPTILLYLSDDAEHNSAVDREPTRYSRQEAAELERATKKPVESRYIYRDPFWFFQNTDQYGLQNPDFANQGRLDLRGASWQTVIEGAMELAYYEKLQRLYVAGSGGHDALREADDLYNDLNRKIIDAFYKANGKAFLGDINLSVEKRERIASGAEGVFGEYTGQLVYNFGCNFVIPVADKELEQLILDWNRDGWPRRQPLVCQITAAVERIGGRCFLWY